MIDFPSHPSALRRAPSGLTIGQIIVRTIVVIVAIGIGVVVALILGVILGYIPMGFC